MSPPGGWSVALSPVRELVFRILLQTLDIRAILRDAYAKPGISPTTSGLRGYGDSPLSFGPPYFRRGFRPLSARVEMYIHPAACEISRMGRDVMVDAIAVFISPYLPIYRYRPGFCKNSGPRRAAPVFSCAGASLSALSFSTYMGEIGKRSRRLSG